MSDLNKINIVNKNSKEYPRLLKEIQNPPEKIFILGKLPDDPPVGGPKIAIVGTRKATDYGKSLAKKLARALTEIGAIIVSGLAMGIDTAAHEGAIEAKGKTIAVLANGLDIIYPKQNENLSKKILELNGAIISEYEPGKPALEHQFLERNRIVSGLSVATIVIEAPERSGSIVTARLAAEQGREVFVAPGQVNHPNYKGSHQLIRDGARLITSIDDIIEDLGLENYNLKLKNSKQIPNLKNINDRNQLLILKIIKETGEPANIDKIIETTKLEPQTINQAIAFLIIEGIIKETERGYTIY
ncbi:MAG: protecting protein DprA, DNA processing protein [Candidatus Wolfebacteria bacterium GW2011_GWC1_37_10]|uniref:Protecting protein DprA, DNA processing protein n=1 Tax=Candidatus Wolfebacteria bacterium GW2011_GWC1_37_10 TaxID=1619010 RepID=A0A0G0IFQ9_9BACT|nr:MAG: protecting protein DprA, DNA processing protein [Candidatus Wolfebacteria bacterium GW2011_GWC1_37_10]